MTQADLDETERVWITRAQPGADRTAERLGDLGYVPIIAPLLAVEVISGAVARIDLTNIAAIAFTSANGVTAFAAQTSGLRQLPVFAVGQTTAQAAAQSGFEDVRCANGDAAILARLIADAGLPSTACVLAPRAEHPAADLSALLEGVVGVLPVAVYRTVDTEVSPPDVFEVVLIHSPRAAQRLARMIVPEQARRCRVVAISDAAVHPVAHLNWAQMQVADAPTGESVLTALGKPGPRV